jgi:hypothetical protein
MKDVYLQVTHRSQDFKEKRKTLPLFPKIAKALTTAAFDTRDNSE